MFGEGDRRCIFRWEGWNWQKMTKSRKQLLGEISQVLNGVDCSSNSTVVEYAVQNLFKRQSPRKASENTAKSLSGSPNLFLGVHPPHVVQIDPAKLEEAIWGRLVDSVIQGIESFRVEKAHYALDATLNHFEQRPTLRKELKRRVIERLGRDPFAGLE